ncbi:MAG: acyl-CoA/acyl-ACP dehydrogenase [bacterium]|nr:acyl-CoA/acyl-ACP dehydrogenase [Acidimicrobiia bacterium]MCY4648771.1 acyl-CoA/acyl-ACP dehydrogenase [bacterium]
MRGDLLDFLRSEIEPQVDGWEEAGHVPPEALWKVGRRFGLLGMMTPIGRGGDPRPWTEIVEVATDLGRIYRPFGFLLTNALIAGYLAAVTDDLQWKRLGLPIVEGRASSVLALNEPDSGNDLSALASMAEKDEGGYRIRGVKTYIPNADQVDFLLLAARERPGDPPSIFAVDPASSGCRVRRLGATMALRGVHLCEIKLEGCVVSGDDRLGEMAGLWPHLGRSRLLTSGLALGIAVEALELALDYTARTERFGKPLNRQGAVQQSLADMGIAVETGRVYLAHAASLVDAGHPASLETSVAKTYITDLAMRVTTSATQLMGGWGYLVSGKVERLMREAKLNQIVDGANEIHRTLIAKSLSNRAKKEREE